MTDATSQALALAQQARAQLTASIPGARNPRAD